MSGRPGRSGLLGTRVDHLLWDWNGTLLDDIDLCVDVMNGLLAEHALPRLDRERYRGCFDFPVRSYYERLGFDLTGGRFEELGMRFIEGYYARVEECELHSGAAELLAQLAEAGIPMTILSASHTDAIQEVLARRGIDRHFVEVLGLDDHYAHGKEQIAEEWLSRSGADAERTLLIGDTLHDHEVAEVVGVQCVLVAHGHHPADRLRASGRVVVEGLGELDLGRRE